jgi:hypothetical protein
MKFLPVGKVSILSELCYGGVYCSSLLFNISAVGGEGWEGERPFALLLNSAWVFLTPWDPPLSPCHHDLHPRPFSLTDCTVDVFSVLRPYWSALIPRRSFFFVIGQVFVIHWESVFSLATATGAPIPSSMIGNFLIWSSKWESLQSNMACVNHCTSTLLVIYESSFWVGEFSFDSISLIYRPLPNEHYKWL